MIDDLLLLMLLLSLLLYVEIGGREAASIVASKTSISTFVQPPAGDLGPSPPPSLLQNELPVLVVLVLLFERLWLRRRIRRGTPFDEWCTEASWFARSLS